MRRPALYLAIFAVSALLTAAAGWLLLAAKDSLACDSSGYRHGYFMAYCDYATAGDYEHGALYYGLERTAIRQLQQADVVLMGNSRLMFATSTAATDDFFRRLGLRYYVLGFGYGETSEFPLKLLMRYGVHPRAVIVNADPFFQPGLSPPAADVTSGKPEIFKKYVGKAMAQRVHKSICRLWPSACQPRANAIFRSVRDGRWHWEGSFQTGQIFPLTADHTLPAWFDENLRALAGVGDDFRRTLGLERRCILLTGIPVPAIDSSAMAEKLGAAMAVPVVTARVTDLHTIDGSHLDSDSANRWAAAFFANLEPALESCLKP